MLQLAEALKGNEHLRELDVGGNNIEADGVKALLNALRGSRTLQTLELSYNPFGVEGAKAVTDVLKYDLPVRSRKPFLSLFVGSGVDYTPFMQCWFWLEMVRVAVHIGVSINTDTMYGSMTCQRACCASSLVTMHGFTRLMNLNYSCNQLGAERLLGNALRAEDRPVCGELSIVYAPKVVPPQYCKLGRKWGAESRAPALSPQACSVATHPYLVCCSLFVASGAAEANSQVLGVALKRGPPSRAGANLLFSQLAVSWGCFEGLAGGDAAPESSGLNAGCLRTQGLRNLRSRGHTMRSLEISDSGTLESRNLGGWGRS